MRCFVAIELAETLQEKLAQLQRELQVEAAGRLVRWVAPGGIHLTLDFLGEAPERQCGEILEALIKACSGTAPFDLTAQGLGGFPSLWRPRVVWVGLEGETEAAARLTERVQMALAELGFAPEARPFTAHLTLGRVRREAGSGERTAIGEMLRRANGRWGALETFRVDRVDFIQSELTPRGAIYTRLGSVPLSDGAG